MRKSWITLGALFTCVTALGLLVWLKPPKQQNASVAVTTLKSADVRTLRVRHKGAPLASLEKRGNDWFLTEPINVPADSFQVLRLLAVLDAKSTSQYPVADSARFELDAPQTEIIINDQRFLFGAINNVTREQYLLAQNQIYTVEPRFAAAVPANANALIRRSVLAPVDVPERFEFGAFTITTDGKKWSTTPPAGDISQDDYNRWVAQWREGSALRSEIADDRKTGHEIIVTLKGGAKIVLGVLQSDAELVVRRADIGLQFVFTGDVGKQMMAAPITRK